MGKNAADVEKCGNYGKQAAFDGVKQALSDGTLTQARIDESVLRILQVKAEYNILQ